MKTVKKSRDGKVIMKEESGIYIVECTYLSHKQRYLNEKEALKDYRECVTECIKYTSAFGD